MEDVIHIAAELPKAPSSLPVPRTGPPVGIRSEALTKAMREHFEHRRKQLGIEGRGRDLGERMELLTEEHSLEVYAASDSVWYANRPRAYGVEPAEKLPDAKGARAFADEVLERFGLADPHLRFLSVEKTMLSTSVEPKSEPKRRALRLDVCYGFSIEGFGVRGPGAKVLVGLTGPKELAELVWFWREVELGKPEEIFQPDRALDIFRQQKRFRQLKAKHTRIVVESCELGYYAMGPRQIQRLLAPVYTIKGTERSGDLETGFTAYVLAARIPLARAKAQQLLDGRVPRVIVGE